MSENKVPGVRGFQHLGIPVHNMESSIEWYRKYLGFKEIYRTEFDMGEGLVKIAFLELNGFQIEFFELPLGELEDVKARQNGRIDHLCFDVEDIEAVGKALREAGIETYEEEPRFLPIWPKGVKILNAVGPNNEKIEFNQILR